MKSYFIHIVFSSFFQISHQLHASVVHDHRLHFDIRVLFRHFFDYLILKLLEDPYCLFKIRGLLFKIQVPPETVRLPASEYWLCERR